MEMKLGTTISFPKPFNSTFKMPTFTLRCAAPELAPASAPAPAEPPIAEPAPAAAASSKHDEGYSSEERDIHASERAAARNSVEERELRHVGRRAAIDYAPDGEGYVAAAAEFQDKAWPSRAELHTLGYTTVRNAVPPAWLDADQIEQDATDVRTGIDRDGPVKEDSHRRMRTMPPSFCSLVGGLLTARFREDGVLGNRDKIEPRLFVSRRQAAPIKSRIVTMMIQWIQCTRTRSTMTMCC